MLGDNIKNLRKSRGYTQEELAIRLNVVRQTVSKWKKGFSVPDAEVLQRMAEVLEVDVKQLLGAKDFASCPFLNVMVRSALFFGGNCAIFTLVRNG